MSGIEMQEGQEVEITVTAQPGVKDSVMRAVSSMLAGEGVNCRRIECGYTKDVASFVRQRQPSLAVRKDEILKAWPAEGLIEADLCAWTVQTASNMTPGEAWLYALESEEGDMYRAARVRLAMGFVRGEGEVISESPTLRVRRLRDKINREQAMKGWPQAREHQLLGDFLNALMPMPEPLKTQALVSDRFRDAAIALAGLAYQAAKDGGMAQSFAKIILDEVKGK